MSELPKRFPEYAIMYKTLTRKIHELEQKIKTVQIEEKTDVEKSIKRYSLEREKIRKMFPNNFFKDLEI